MTKKTTSKGKSNPRVKNGNLRRKYRARLKAQGGPCGICCGILGPIHYDEPSDWKHPLSFVVDEIIPVSRWKEYGYNSPEAAAQDWSNLQAAHWCCNQAKSNKVSKISLNKQKNDEFCIDKAIKIAKRSQKEVIKQRNEQINLPDGVW